MKTDAAIPADDLDLKAGTIMRAIYEALVAAPSREARIVDLYAAASPEADLPSSRRQMQRVGPFVRQLNAKLLPHGRRIGPGVARRTYRIETAPVAAVAE